MLDPISLTVVCPACRQAVTLTIDPWEDDHVSLAATWVCPACQQLHPLPVVGRVVSTEPVRSARKPKAQSS